MPGSPGSAPLLDGFWLPREVRERVLGPRDEAVERWDTLWFRHGRECAAPPLESGGGPSVDGVGPAVARDGATGAGPAGTGGGPNGAVGARWPRLSAGQWDRLLAALEESRRRAPAGRQLRERLGAALRTVAADLAQTPDPSHAAATLAAVQQSAAALAALPTYTGYSPEMVRFALTAPALWSFDGIEPALHAAPTWAAAVDWIPMPGLPGRLRFFPAASRRARIAGLFGGRSTATSGQPIFGPAEPPDLVVGYGAGNVPGTALIIAMLALATSLSAGWPPVLLVRNSRREPIFAPLVLREIERADPGLVGSVAMLVWDHDDDRLQRHLLGRAGLVVAAAGDAAITRLRQQTAAAGTARFHAHGHKVSFTAIAREALERRDAPAVEGAAAESAVEGGAAEPAVEGAAAQPAAACALPLDDVALLAALDTVMWDQNGCLSPRVHFVETGPASAPGAVRYAPRAYAEALVDQLRSLAVGLPRGAWPRSVLHDRFDYFATLTTTGAVHLLSAYDDDFVVALDERPPGDPRQAAAAFATLVNQCQGRVVVVRPVTDLMDVPKSYLSLLPVTMLQSLSVATGPENDGLDRRLLSFAEACGACGVTSIRPVGRGAFPQLAYSWDGLLPLDLLHRRPQGWFTTIETDRPFAAMVATAAAVRGRLRTCPCRDVRSGRSWTERGGHETVSS